MSVTIAIPFDQIKEMIEQLSSAELEELKTQLENVAEQKKKSNQDRLKELLLQGPVMGKQQIDEIEEAREKINQWRT